MATAPSSRAVRPRPSNEQLAKQLMDCAIFVKKGQKSPLLNQTIHDLMEFMATENGDVSPRQHQHKHSSSNRQEAAVSKPTKPALAMLGKMVGVTTSSSSPTGSHRSDASKRATSSKNAARAKADLQQQMQQHHGSAGKSTWYAGHHDESEWCDVHFCMGCACKESKNNSNPKAVPTATQRAPPSPTRSTASSAATSHQHPATSSSSTSSKPAFQRPTNPKSSLIANGWIEQQRRSKMRIVWKDVLASLVEGRKPGEETTLWIQREVTDSSTGKPKLEALHQIPCKWIQNVTLEQYAADNKFSLKVYNLTDEFVFRCPGSEVAAQEWVSTLLSLKESTQAGSSNAKKNEPRNAVDEWENENKVSSRPQRSSFEDEKKSDTTTTTKSQAYPQRPTPPPAGSGSGGATATGGGGAVRISVTELRAIAHGAGINTVGMERGELEAVVAKLASNAMQVSSQPPPPPPPPPQHHHPDPAELERRRRQQEELARMKQKTMEEKARSQQPFDEDNEDDANEDGITKQQKVAAEEEAAAKRRAAEEEEASRRKAEEEEEAARRRAVEKEEEEARRQADEEARKAKEAEEEHRRRIAERVHKQQHEARLKKEEEERKRLEAERLEREEEEHRRRVAEMQAAEERRRQEEMLRQQQQQWQQQQQQWQQQQAEEAKRAAEERRRHEEHLRQQQQQWHQQQQHAAQQQHWQQQQQQQQPHWQQHQHVPPHGFQGHPNQQQFPRAPQQPHNAQHPHGPPPPNTGSPINMKYAQMAHQTENQNAMSEQGIKHAVLVEWALQPPMLQVLRPIEVLISSIHNVFPPRFGIQPHEYFSKWRGLSLSDVTLGPSEGNRPDAKKLERAKKKLQLFLHTDKHPKDFTAQQSFLCRLLWDISNDAWNEYKTKEEELGWMR